MIPCRHRSRYAGTYIGTHAFRQGRAEGGGAGRAGGEAAAVPGNLRRSRQAHPREMPCKTAHICDVACERLNCYCDQYRDGLCSRGRAAGAVGDGRAVRGRRAGAPRAQDARPGLTVLLVLSLALKTITHFLSAKCGFNRSRESTTAVDAAPAAPGGASVAESGFCYLHPSFALPSIAQRLYAS